MKLLTILLLLLSITSSAQNHRFIYEYTFVKDSLQKEETTVEDMYLDITPKGSKYYSFAVYESDSISKAEMEKQIRGADTNVMIKMTHKRKGVVKSVLEKTYPDFEISQFESVGGVNYKVADDRKIKWKIEPETMKIGEFSAQKATTEMYGRKWIAWFANELPFQEGPYKFYGLPGLIVKLEDSSNSHIMELKGVKTLPKDFELKSALEKNTFTKTVEMEYPKYKKAYQNFLKNPVSPMRSISTTGKFTMKDQDGNLIDMNKMMRDSEEKMKAANKKINNLLELDLLK